MRKKPLNVWTQKDMKWTVEDLIKATGLPESVFSKKNQPCPLCGGKDRFRYTEFGQFICNQCIPDTCTPSEFIKKLGKEPPKEMDKKPVKGAPTIKAIIPAPQLCGAGPVANQVFSFIAHGTGAQKKDKYDLIHDWLTEDGELIGYIARKNLEGGKKVCHLMFCPEGKTSWHQGTFDNRPLYGLQPGKKVLVVEGEKTRDAARKMLGANWVVVTSVLGAGAASKTNWLPLKDRIVYIWPDNDLIGQKYAKSVAHLLTDIADEVNIIQLPRDVPEGWDLADADGWTESDVLKYIDAAKPLMEVEAEGIEKLLRPLGYDEDKFYYFPRSQLQVRCLTSSAHNKTGLLSMLEKQIWEEEFGNNKWIEAADHMMTNCRKRGVYNPEAVRGRGAWWEDGKVVFHGGDKLIVDGQEIKIEDYHSEYVYEKQPRLRVGGNITDDELTLIYSACVGLRWEDSKQGHYLTGLLVAMAVGGALKWRPHGWLTGEKGCGKSTVLTHLVFAVLGRCCLRVQGDTTAAGIRQCLKTQSLPVVFDEAEDQDLMQAVLATARGASGETQMLTLKGTQGGKSMSFNIRSCFLFASINTSLKQASDESRNTVLRLKASQAVTTRESIELSEQYTKWLDIVDNFKPNLGERFVAHCIRKVPEIRKKIDEVKIQLMKNSASARDADQYATMMGCASVIFNVDMFDWAKQEMNLISTHQGVIESLLTHSVRTEGMEGRNQETILSLIQMARDSDITIQRYAIRNLADYGMSVKRKPSPGDIDDEFAIYCRGSNVKRVCGLLGIANLEESLLRLPNAYRNEGAVRIHNGVFKNVINVPIRFLPFLSGLED